MTPIKTASSNSKKRKLKDFVSKENNEYFSGSFETDRAIIKSQPFSNLSSRNALTSKKRKINLEESKVQNSPPSLISLRSNQSL
jgi:hypothetical protein